MELIFCEERQYARKQAGWLQIVSQRNKCSDSEIKLLGLFPSQVTYYQELCALGQLLSLFCQFSYL